MKDKEPQRTEDYTRVLPLETIQRVNTIFTSLKKIDQANVWFRPRTAQELADYLPTITHLTQQLKLATHDYGNLSFYLNSPLDPLLAVIARNAEKAGRKAAVDSLEDLAYKQVEKGSALQLAYAAVTGSQKVVTAEMVTPSISAAGYNAMQIGCIAGLAASWEAVADLPDFEGKKNPGMILLDFYRHGAANVDYKIVNGQKKLVADFPLVQQNEQSTLACIVEDDNELLYQHAWEGSCGDIIPITFNTLQTRQRTVEFLETRQ